MKVTVIDGNDRRHRATVAENSQFVTIDKCQNCGVAEPIIRGTGITHHDHDTYFARCIARCCGVEMRMETQIDTIFGIDEDERVLNGRPRVY